MSLIDFWKSNTSYWIPITDDEKRTVDKIIFDRFYNYDLSKEINIIGKVIYFDQFYRHFHRHLGISNEDMILNLRINATKLILKNVSILRNLDQVELVFALMPFKHIGDYNFIFDIIYNQWEHCDKPIRDFPILSKFHNDTYKKAYTFLKIKNDIDISNLVNFDYNPDKICDYYPDRYIQGNVGICNIPDNIKVDLNKIENPIVSLSGGVDSMVMISLLKLLGKNPIAVHIIYGNRVVSQEEFQFISKYCNYLGVTLYYYKIEWLKRDKVDREFYETMTRDIRFNVYKSLIEPDKSILLGHIRDDIIENIWTNISKCQHINNLKKMSYSEVQQGVKIVRPFLNIDKKLIYKLSDEMAIPYLKNTTPSWSNRGKFRDKFYNEIHCQFGVSVDDKIICFAEILENQSKMLEKLMYEPIYNSFNNNQINITPAVIGGLDKGGWIRIFEYISHNILGRSKPSIKSIDEFISRLNRSIEKNIVKSYIVLKSNFKILVENKNNNWFIHFIT
jgi:tRNA(Ile)-lysidine synthetase-like protein